MQCAWFVRLELLIPAEPFELSTFRFKRAPEPADSHPTITLHYTAVDLAMHPGNPSHPQRSVKHPP